MDDYIKILGLDPGNRLGISVLFINPFNFIIEKIESRTITLERYVHEHPTSDLRLLFLRNVILDLYKTYRPNCISMELAFLNIRYPKAVIQLSQYISVIESTFLFIDPTIKLLKYAPMYIKNTASGTGKADKEDMMTAVQNNKELSKLLNTDIMSEHEIDATCIAYTAYKEIQNNIYYLLAM